MNRTSPIATFLLLLAWGFLAGFVCLAVASLLDPFLNHKQLNSLYLLVLLEETVKFGALLLLFNYNIFTEEVSWIKIIFAGIIFGLGFSLFEIGLIYLGHEQIPLLAFAPALIHLSTSALLASAIKTLKAEKNNLSALVLICFAVLVHLCYNVFVAIGMQ